MLYLMFKKLKRSLLSVLLLISAFTMSALPAEVKTDPVKVTFISVATDTEAYWGDIHALAKAAASDLGVELEILLSHRNHLAARELAIEVSERENKPDYVIVVGEMRDLETIQLALTAAETGHLVIATLHTGNAPRTLDRILDVFPTDQRSQIRIMVAESLRGILSQQLIPRADGTGRELAIELLVNTAPVAATIRDGKTFMLPGIMQTGKNVGMRTMDESLRDIYNKGQATQEEILYRAEDKKQMELYFQS